jgi:hypothetical protein
VEPIATKRLKIEAPHGIKPVVSWASGPFLYAEIELPRGIKPVVSAGHEILVASLVAASVNFRRQAADFI